MADASKLGLSSVTTSTWCSAHDRPEFYSHRASNGADGRMVAYIGIPGVLASNLIPE
jgi:copper oxidase (laccase) domain-containing protein